MSEENGRPENETTAVNCDADSTTVERVTDKNSPSKFLPEHRLLLQQAGIPEDFAYSHGVRSVTTAADLPISLRWAANGTTPTGLLFEWRPPDRQVEYQYRPDVPLVIGDAPEPRKYIQGQDVRLVNVLGDASTAENVLVVEGTKQTLAAAAHAPDGWLVVGIPGCANGLQDGLLVPGLADLIEGKACVVCLDADMRSNADVWSAADQLGQALDFEGALSVRYVHLPGRGKQGLDDLLAGVEESKRPKSLQRLLDKAEASLPPRPKVQHKPGVDQRGRPPIDVTLDRLDVIDMTMSALVDRWDGTRLFDHGDVIGDLRGHGIVNLDRGRLRKVLVETAQFYRPSNYGIKPAWPDAGVIEAVAASADDFVPLDRVSRVPFLRKDGTICQTAGYDASSRTVLVVDEQLGLVAVPDAPSNADVAAAVLLILDGFLGDFPFQDQASRANALGLILTPFIRGLVPLVPLVVVDGLQMGVGKNLLADCFAIVVTGANADPLPFPRDEEELRKVITSTFRTGADLFVFDEAHVVGGTPLARALTATTWNDRILGYSRLAQYPNQITWMSLGNQVRVEGDLARRVCRIGLHPKDPNPENRQASSFRHPDLREWTRANRARLVEAALTLVRAWYVAGQPVAPEGVSFGSFESWQHMVGGILHVAGVEGFLSNLGEWRGDADLGTMHWTAHLEDLYVEFGEDAFITAEVLEAMEGRRILEAPPGLESFRSAGYTRELGKAYYSVRDRWFGTLRLVRAGSPGNGGARGSVNRWRVEVREEQQPTRVTGPEEVMDRPAAEGWEGWEGSPDTSFQPAVPPRALAAASESTQRPPAQVAAMSGVSAHPSHPSVPSAIGLNVTFSATEEGRLEKLAAEMSRTGLRVDTELLRARLDVQTETSERLLRTLVRRLELPDAAATSPRPWTTTAGLAAFDRLVDAAWPRLANGKPQITKELVAAAAASDGVLGDVCSLIGQLVEISPFAEALEGHRLGDRVHPVYAAKTHTGRWSSTGPNILGVGHRTERLLQDRDLILAEPGHVMIGVDLAGIDARCVAGLSGDRGYAELFQPGRDIHSEISQLFFGDVDHRQQAKAITHGIPYGRGARAIASETGMSIADTERMIAAYFEHYPAIRKWQEHMRRLAAQGQPLPTGTGRSVLGDAERAHTTAPARAAQACARDIAAFGLLRIVDAGLRNYMRLFLHDELVLSVPEAEADELWAKVRELMSFDWLGPTGLVVPIVATASDGSGPRWSELYRPQQAVRPAA